MALLNIYNNSHCRDASFEDVHKTVVSLPNIYSVRKNPEIFVKGLKAYIQKIYEASGDKGVMIEEGLLKLNKVLNLFNERQVLLYDINRKERYYWNYDERPYEVAPGCLTANIYSLYVSRLGDHPERVNIEPYKTVLSTLSTMADDVKAQDFNWKIKLLKDTDEALKRSVDPIFEHIASLHGLSAFQPTNKKSYYYGAQTNALPLIFEANAKEYLDVLYTHARAENKLQTLNSWVKSTIIAGNYQNNALASHTQDELVIQKEYRQVKDVMKNYNKKEIKKKAKEKATLAQLQELIQKSAFSNSQEKAPLVVETKPKKFKL